MINSPAVLSWMAGLFAFNMEPVESLEDMRRRSALDHALRSRTGVTRFPPVPVTVRAITGHAIAQTDTQVLVEWVKYGDYHVRWEDKWQVHRAEG